MAATDLVTLLLLLSLRVVVAVELNGGQREIIDASVLSFVPEYARTVVHKKEAGGYYKADDNSLAREADDDTSIADDQIKSRHRESAVPRARNWRTFAIILCFAFAVLAFAFTIYLRRDKRPAPKPDPVPEQSTLMSEMIPRVANKWEKRGVILGILVSLSSLSAIATDVLAMHPIYIHLKNWTQCDEGGPFGMVLWESKLCVYTSAYIWTAPQLTLAAALLLVARTILQHRLYYALLKAGGVLDYHRSTAMRDPFFLLLLWWFAHVIMYVAFLGYMFSNHDGNDALVKEEVQRIIDVLTYAVVPLAVFIFLFNSKYDLEQHLVPLSEIVDAEDSQQSFLASLCILDESATRDVLESNTKISSPLSQTADDQTKYAEIVQLCRTRMKENSAASLQPSHLWNYLWPSTVLLSRKTLGSNARFFRKFWCLYLAFAILALVLSGIFLGYVCYEQLLLGRYFFMPPALAMVAVLVVSVEKFCKASIPLVA